MSDAEKEQPGFVVATKGGDEFVVVFVAGNFLAVLLFFEMWESVVDVGGVDVEDGNVKIVVGEEERHVAAHGAGTDYADLYEVRSMVIIVLEAFGSIDWAEI